MTYWGQVPGWAHVVWRGIQISAVLATVRLVEGRQDVRDGEGGGLQGRVLGAQIVVLRGHSIETILLDPGLMFLKALIDPAARGGFYQSRGERFQIVNHRRVKNFLQSTKRLVFLLFFFSFSTMFWPFKSREASWDVELYLSMIHMPSST